MAPGSSPQSSPRRVTRRSRSRSRTPATPAASTRRTRSQTPRTPAQAGGDGTPGPSSSPLPYGGGSSSPPAQRRGSSSPRRNTSSSPRRTSSSPRHAVGGTSPGTAAAMSSPLPYGSPRTPAHAATPGSQETPVRPRGDLGRNRTRREFTPGRAQTSDHTSTDGNALPSDGGTLLRSVVWGTDVNVQETMSKFKQFIRTFTDAMRDTPKYPTMITNLARVEENNAFFDVDCEDLHSSDAALYQQTVRYPQEVIPMFDNVVHELYEEYVPEDDTPPFIQVRLFNTIKKSVMRELNPEVRPNTLTDIDQLVSIRGMVIRTSAIMPDPKEGYFECSLCKFSIANEVDRGRIEEPKVCGNCNSQMSMSLVHNRCKFADKQMVKIQESPENIPEGQTPLTVLAFVYDSMVDTVQPGDRVELTGIYRATPLRVIKRQRTVKSTFKTHLDVIHFAKTSKNRVFHETDASTLDPTEKKEMEERLRRIAEQPDVYTRLARALAPNIFEFEDVKRGVLAQLFGGVHKNFEQAGRGRFRGEINVLLCGDPSTAKSQLLQYAVNLAPRSIYTSGRGSSAVGLTAYVTKDPETKATVLESGALVLCDGGVCCIDEFDKMNDSTRVILHEVMEQQTVSVAKAGIICSLNARTAVLAAANPQDSRWNKRLSIVENIQLPPTLLSRFDLIYLILDTPDTAKDQRLARHVVSLYFSDQPTRPGQLMNRETLAEFIWYAREFIHPELTEEATRDLVSEYVNMRKAGSSRNTITATPRQLESLIRLAEAHARMRFSQTVDRSDVAEAVRLMKVALQQAATDPRTGLVDMDLLTTGHSMAERSRLGDLARAIADILGKETSKTISVSALQRKIDAPVRREDLDAALAQLESDEFIKMPHGRTDPNPLIRIVGTTDDQ
eukprot:m.185521 g.185521  ORF g.185521 m.185521 type:complete len:897 (+) comp18117_c0_seq5:150-2840(+)